ncbi:MAG: thioredoxin [Oscillospiraceae bacterium]|nr:thioredoxin [Oscillospiraceae bacterium]
MSTVNLSLENFDEVIEKGRVLVDFWAAWCNPCRLVAPILDELAEEYEGRLLVGKVDVDAETELALRYDIVSIPTVVLFQDGLEIRRFVGVQPKRVYQQELVLRI